jgi:hypothetical protein
MTQEPMSLEKLPEYLKSLKEKGEFGSPVLVDTGQIVVERSWPKRIVFATLLFVILGVGSVMTLHLTSTKHHTVLMDVTNPQTISKIVSDSGGQVLSINQEAGSTYKVKVATRKSGPSFLEWLRKNAGVKKADLED